MAMCQCEICFWCGNSSRCPNCGTMGRVVNDETYETVVPAPMADVSPMAEDTVGAHDESAATPKEVPRYIWDLVDFIKKAGVKHENGRLL